MSEPNPCPFCGFKDTLQERNEHGWPIVRCSVCGACGPCTNHNPENAVTAWNRRQQITPQAAEHIPNAEFCPHCNPCRNTWGMVEAQRLNEQYDECLRDLAAYVGAGGYNSAGLIDPKIANEKVRWGIDHIVRVQHAKPDDAAPPQGEAEPWGWYDPATETIYKIPVDVYPSDAIPLYRTAPPRPADTANNYHDAYRGAMDDMYIWKRRALESERETRAVKEKMDRYGLALMMIKEGVLNPQQFAAETLASAPPPDSPGAPK